MPRMVLDARERARYDRHLKLPQVGESGQEKLRSASVLLIGAGGLGSPLALYLAAAGVGRLGVVDHDSVDASNLQRQILHSTADVGRPKVDSARERLQALNPSIEIETFHTALTANNALELVSAFDITADGSDNFTTRYLVNDACVIAGKPNVHGSIYRFEGQASVFMRGGPCYRCIFPEPPPAGAVPSCEEAGVLGVLPGVIGTIQANEVLKLILGIGRTLAGRLLVYDALEMRFRELKVERNRSCAVCGDAPTITSVSATEFSCAVEERRETLTPDELLQRIERGEAPQIIDVRETHEWRSGHLAPAEHIALGTLPNRLDEIARDRDVVVYCQMGGRSARAVALLKEHGFDNAINLEGGFTRWLREAGEKLVRR